MLLGCFESTITTDGKTGTHALPTKCRRSVAALMSGEDQQESASRRTSSMESGRGGGASSASLSSAYACAFVFAKASNSFRSSEIVRRVKKNVNSGDYY